MNKPISILIISYLFPPFLSVGGRRWLKFAKYLGRNNVTVNVIHAKNPFTDESPWSEELNNLSNVFTHPISHAYPKILFHTPTSIHRKVIYKAVSLVLAKLFPGYFFDWSLLWRRQLLKSARKLICQSNIDTVIISAPPYRQLHHALRLKKEFPHLTLIADFRDPWLERLEAQNVPGHRLAYERTLEKVVLEGFDVVLSVNDVITSVLSHKCPPNQKSKFYTVMNGFDPEDVTAGIQLRDTSSEIRLIHTGEVYNHIGHLVKPFFAALEEMKSDPLNPFKDLFVDFFGDKNPEHQSPYIHFHHTTPRSELGKHLHSASAGIVFLPDHLDYIFSTKFVEYIGHKKPILLISKYGPTAEFITNNRLGYWLDPKNMYQSLVCALKGISGRNGDFAGEDLRNRFSLPHITDLLLKIIQQNSKT